MDLDSYQRKSSAVEGHILRGRHFVGVEVSNLSTFSNTGCPLILGINHTHNAVRFHTVSTESNTLHKTLDRDNHTFGRMTLSDERFGEEVNDGGGVGQLHWVVPLSMFLL